MRFNLKGLGWLAAAAAVVSFTTGRGKDDTPEGYARRRKVAGVAALAAVLLAPNAGSYASVVENVGFALGGAYADWSTWEAQRADSTVSSVSGMFDQLMADVKGTFGGDS